MRGGERQSVAVKGQGRGAIREGGADARGMWHVSGGGGAGGRGVCLWGRGYSRMFSR